MAVSRAVVDTNVLRPGLYSAKGASFVILRAIEERRLVPVLSTTLLFEYEEIVRRHQEALRLSNRAVEDVLDAFCERGEHRRIYFLWRPQLADPKDDHILELAVASESVPIVTYNVKDFGAADRFGVRVMKPAELIGELK